MQHPSVSCVYEAHCAGALVVGLDGGCALLGASRASWCEEGEGGKAGEEGGEAEGEQRGEAADESDAYAPTTRTGALGRKLPR